MKNEAVRGVGFDERLAFRMAEFSALSGIGRRKLEYEIAAGRLRACHAGRRTLILKRDALAYLESLPAAQFVPRRAA